MTLINLETLGEEPTTSTSNVTDVTEYMDISDQKTPEPSQDNSLDDGYQKAMQAADELISALKGDVQEQPVATTTDVSTAATITVDEKIQEAKDAVEESNNKTEEVLKDITNQDIDIDTFDFDQYMETEDFKNLPDYAKKVMKITIDDNKKIVNMTNILIDELENSKNELENERKKNGNNDLLQAKIDKLTGDYVDVESKAAILQKQKAPEFALNLIGVSQKFVLSKLDSDKIDLVKETQKYLKNLGIEVTIQLPENDMDVLSESSGGGFNSSKVDTSSTPGYF